MNLIMKKKYCFILSVSVLVLFLAGLTTANAQTWEKVIDFGDPGYVERGSTWRTYVNGQSHRGSYRYLSHFNYTRRRVGTATWTTVAPYSGTYRVSISFRRTENRSPDANYFVTNNSGELDEFVINQSGHLEFVWAELGLYHYRKGQTIKVLLDGTDDTYSDCADATKWTLVELDPPTVIPPVNSLLLKVR